MKRFKNIFQKLLIFAAFSVCTGCSGGGWSAPDQGAETARGLIVELNGYLRPLVFALAIAGVAYNAVTIIMGPTSGRSGDDVIAIARRRIIIIVCAVISFLTIDRLFKGGF